MFEIDFSIRQKRAKKEVETPATPATPATTPAPAPATPATLPPILTVASPNPFAGAGLLREIGGVKGFIQEQQQRAKTKEHTEPNVKTPNLYVL